MREKDLATSEAELRKAATELDKARAGAVTVRIERTILSHLVTDHSRMAREIFVDRYRKEA